MALRLLGHIELPANKSIGGFDHADIHPPTDRLYVAHTSNDAIDVVDIARDKYIELVPGLTGVAGALVSEARALVFTSNRDENTVSVFAPGTEQDAFKIGVGMKPNGLAFDAARGILIAANLGDAAVPGSHTVSVVDVARRERIAEVMVPGRTRWTVLTRRGRRSSSTSLLRRKSSRSMPVIRPGFRGCTRFRPMDRTDWISTLRQAGCSARVMPAS